MITDDNQPTEEQEDDWLEAGFNEDSEPEESPTPPSTITSEDSVPSEEEGAPAGPGDPGDPDEDYDQALLDDTPAEPKPPEEDSPEELRRKLKESEEKNAKIEQRLRTVEGRFGAVNDVVADLKQQVTALKPKDRPTDEQVNEAISDPEAFEVFKHEFPDVADHVQKIVDLQSKALLSKIPQVDVDDLTDRVSKTVTEQLSGRLNTQASDNDSLSRDEVVQMMTISSVHPTWLRDINSKPFAAWLERQDGEIQQKMDSPEANDAIEVLDKFKADVDAARQRMERKQSARRPTNGRRPAGATRGGMSEEDWLEEGFKNG